MFGQTMERKKKVHLKHRCALYEYEKDKKQFFWRDL